MQIRLNWIRFGKRGVIVCSPGNQDTWPHSCQPQRQAKKWPDSCHLWWRSQVRSMRTWAPNDLQEKMFAWAMNKLIGLIKNNYLSYWTISDCISRERNRIVPKCQQSSWRSSWAPTWPNMEELTKQHSANSKRKAIIFDFHLTKKIHSNTYLLDIVAQSTLHIWWHFGQQSPEAPIVGWMDNQQRPEWHGCEYWFPWRLYGCLFSRSSNAHRRLDVFAFLIRNIFVVFGWTAAEEEP